MKRLSLLGFVGLMASVLAGCPIFGDGGGGTQGCHGDSCVTPGCGQPSDCQQNETCGPDGQCHSGDCTLTGCVAGYTCTVDPSSQTASCVPKGSSSSSSGGTGGGGTGGASTSSSTSTSSSSSGTGGGSPVYCGHPSDCPTGQICASDGTCKPGPCSASNACIYGYTCQADGTCKSGTPNACDSDANCSSGDLCIAGSDGKGGVCTTPANQCFDQSQCGTNEKCVAGKCTLGCTVSTDCRDGYTCDTTKGVCSVVAKSCTVTNDCGSSAKVCVGGACVPRSSGGMCSAGDVWDENGCIPNQAATFVCATDGQLGSGAGVPGQTCAAGSICLHHDCWISCDAPNGMVCATQSTLNQCKPVADGMMTYSVCGSSSNLGSQCGAGSVGNQVCTGGKVCIDGNCK